MFKKVLIANRGEIAIRVMRSCRELGIDTVSIHSTADENSLHVKMADESVCIGPPQSAQSYLNIQAIMSAVEITGADAIHPGYGFLSESTELAEMCEKYGITFIGPNVNALDMMGDKIRSKQIAKDADVPILEAINVEDYGPEVEKEVKKLGFPVLVKASAGGGGKGMQIVHKVSDLQPTVKKLEREAEAAFGDKTLFIEKYIESPRHIEVQILADHHKTILHLGERDCSVQRNYQKVIEESPSLVLSEEQRKSICADAIKLCKAVKYDSVGTVEFIYDMKDKKYYFMEMNTRIQVEHPVTEERCKIDLISEQIKVAAGKKLEISQNEIEFNNHVIECRLNAEDPTTFAPSPGKIDHYHRPGGMGVRVDDFIYSGYQVPPFYDSMISKIIVSAPDRTQCINRMKRALKETIVGGIKTNIDLHLKILDSKQFQSNNFSTSLIKELLKN